MTLEEEIRECKPRFMSDLEIVSPAAQPADTFLTENRTYGWYYAVAAAKAPKRILETGVKYGYSAIAMCKGAASAGVDPEFVGIDAEADGIACNQIAVAALHALWVRHSILNVNTKDPAAVSRIIGMENGGSFDLIHVDADHSAAGIERELQLAHSWIAADGIILVDDVDTFHVARAAKQFAASLGIEPFILPTQHELMVIDMKARAV